MGREMGGLDLLVRGDGKNWGGLKTTERLSVVRGQWTGRYVVANTYMETKLTHANYLFAIWGARVGWGLS